MEDLLFELVQFILPSLVVFLTAFYLVRKFLASESQKRLIDVRRAKDEIATPIKLQAYERLVIFMERISPENMVLRLHRNGQFASAFKIEMIRSIQEEYEHNLSQQVYVSNEAWNLVKRAKEEIVELVNNASIVVQPSAPAAELGGKLFELASQRDPLAARHAINQLKGEAKRQM